ncbi:MAG: hypothetical protein AAF564_12815 [Bacteroidota bacterium]
MKTDTRRQVDGDCFVAVQRVFELQAHFLAFFMHLQVKGNPFRSKSAWLLPPLLMCYAISQLSTPSKPDPRRGSFRF